MKTMAALPFSAVFLAEANKRATFCSASPSHFDINEENLMSVSLSAVSLIVWTLTLLILLVVLLRKMKGVGIEEIRPV